MAGYDGQVVINTKLDDTDLKKGLSGLSGTLSAGMGGVLKSAEAVTKAVGGIALAVGGAAATLSVKLGKDVVAMFGELQQNLGGADAVFGQYAEAIKAYGEDAYKNLGSSQSDYLATANKMGALFQGSGIEQQKSLDLTVQAMQRAADMASVMGIDVQVALDSVAGAAKGNFTMMDNLGVAMNATTIEAYALSKGLDFTWASATNAEKAELAMQMFFENTSQYAGNFAKESEQTVSGSIGLFKAASESFIAGLGNADADMAKLTANMIDAFDSVIVNVTPILENLVGAVPQALGSIMDAIVTMAPSLVDTASGLFDQVLAVVVDSLPGLVALGSDLVQSLIGGLLQNTDQLSNAAVEIILALVDLITSNLPELAIAAIKIVLAVGQGLVNALPQLASSVRAMIEEFKTKFSEALPDFIEAGKNIVAGLAQGIKDFAAKPVEAVKDAGKKMLDGIKGLFGIQSPSKVFAQIGRFLIEGMANGLNEMFPGLMADSENMVEALEAIWEEGEYKTPAPTTSSSSKGSTAIVPQKSFGDIWGGITDGWDDAKSELSQSITNWTGWASSTFVSLGNSLGDAIGAGMRSLGQFLATQKQTIADLGQSIADIQDQLADAQDELTEAQDDYNDAVLSGDKDAIKAADKRLKQQQKLIDGLNKQEKALKDEKKSIEDGSAAWKTFGKVMLQALADVLYGIGAELAARAAIAAVTFNWAGAAVATAGSVAAFAAGIAVDSWAGSYAEGGIIPQVAGLPSTGDRHVANVNPGELILNQAQQSAVAAQLTMFSRLTDLLSSLQFSAGGGIHISMAGATINGLNEDAVGRAIYHNIRSLQAEGVLKSW